MSSNDALPVVEFASGASSRGGHQLSCADTCERRWALRYYARIEPIGEPEFRLGGTLIHDAVAHRYAQRMMDLGKPAPSWWENKTIEEVLSERGRGYPTLIERAMDVYHMYARYWWGTETEAPLSNKAPEPWEPIAVEEEFRATIGEIDPGGPDSSLDDEIVTCGTDLLVRNTDTGILYVVDHKTKSHAYGRNRDRLPTWSEKGEYRVSLQAMMNLLLIRNTYPDETVGGFIINRITRAEPYCFDRHLLTISPLLYAALPRELRRLVGKERDIREKIERGEKTAQSMHQCYGRYGACDYVDLCAAMSKEEQEIIASTQFQQRG